MPPDLRDNTKAPAILSLEIGVDNRGVLLDELIDALKNIAIIYKSIAALQGLPSEPKLTIINVQSGSPILINLEGLEGVVREARLFISEMWDKVRHRKAHDHISKTSAAFETVQVIAVIAQKEKSGEIGREEAAKLRSHMIRAALALFDNGALPVERRRTEIIDNDKLLSGFSPKLLTTGENVQADRREGHGTPYEQTHIDGEYLSEEFEGDEGLNESRAEDNKRRKNPGAARHKKRSR